MTSGLFKVIRASAGSGKTYSLVKEYLLLALKHNSPWYHRHILAITFTNAAAAEMKERVLLRLQEFCAPGNATSIFSEIKVALHLSDEELKERSNAVYNHMLHNYGQLSILTIDSFTYKLIRSFAHDLHLRHDFNIEMETSTFIESLVDSCIEQIGIDDELTKYIVTFATRNLEEEKTWDIREQLIQISKQILSESGARALEKLDGYSLEDFSTISKTLYKSNQEFENSIAQIANEGLAIFNSASISTSDFVYGGSGTISYLNKISGGTLEMPGTRISTLLGSTNWASKKADPTAMASIHGIKDDLTTVFQKLIASITPETLGAYYIRELIRKNTDSLGMLHRLEEFSRSIKEENNILLISDFHHLVNAIVRENEAPFIYERIGTRYKHILFDEFQDTSQLQWTNALPLIQNSLAENNFNLLVGDAKQAIYRWRGGDVSQFVELPVIAPEANPHRSPAFLDHHFTKEILSENYRSAQEVIAFNNRLYELLAPELTQLKSAYDAHQQNPVRMNIGLVKVETVEEVDKMERWESTAKLIRTYIEECLADGYKPGDIAILTHKGTKEGGKIASMLMEHNYQVVTKDSLLLEHSPVVRTLIAYLEMVSDPDKKFAPIALVQALAELHSQISLDTFIEKNIKRNGKEIEIHTVAYLEEHFGKQEFPFESDAIFSLCITLLRYFNIEPDTCAEFLLEKIKQLCIGRNYTLVAFLQWWQENKIKLYTSSVATSEAIQVMTIHKSKGLQFPVVIYPRLSTQDVLSEIWITPEKEICDLPSALVKLRSLSSKENEGIKWPREFYEENEKMHLDEINTCYVATTRAEDRLYMIQEQSCRKWVSKILLNAFDKHFDGFQTSRFWETGTREQFISKFETDTINVIPFSGEKYLRPQLRILPVKPYQNSHMEYGSRLHLCLAEIKTPDEIVSAVLKVMAAQSIFDDQMKDALIKDLKSVISDNNIAPWFEPGLQLMLEKEICLADNSVARPDRVVIYVDHVDVIDYKTGIHTPQHEAQVRTYVSHLSKIYTQPVQGYLLYTQDLQIIPVNNA